MIFALMKRDPAWKVLPYTVACSVVATLSLGQTGVASLFVSLAFPLLLMVRMHQRVTLFEASLPVDGRDLLKSRLYSMLLCVWLPIGAVLFTEAIRNHAAEGFLGRLPGLGTAESLAIFVMLTRQLPQFGIRPVEAALMWCGCLAAAIAGMIMMPEQTFWPTAAAIIVAGTGWLAWTWPRQTFSFTCAPGGVSASGNRSREAFGPRELWPTTRWTPLIRTLYPWQSWIWLTLAAIMPLSMGNLAFPLLYVTSALGQAGSGINWSMTLPVSRRTVLALTITPFFVAFIASFLIGINIWPGPQGTGNVIRLYGPNQLQVPFTYWEKASPAVPRITAPWGETNLPVARRILLAKYYNPYSVAAENSPRFRDWQYRRATKTIYGLEIPLSHSGDAARVRPLTWAPRPRFLTLMTLISLGVILCTVGLLPQWPALHGLPSSVLNAVSAFGFLALLLLVPVPLVLPGIGNNVVLEMWVQKLSLLLPENTVVMAGIVLLVFGCLVFLLDRLFANIEMNVSAMRSMAAIT